VVYYSKAETTVKANSLCGKPSISASVDKWFLKSISKVLVVVVVVGGDKHKV
jgi:hypothetical protein